MAPVERNRVCTSPFVHAVSTELRRFGAKTDTAPALPCVQEAAQKDGLLYRLYNIDFDQAKSGREGWVLYPRCRAPSHAHTRLGVVAKATAMCG